MMKKENTIFYRFKAYTALFLILVFSLAALVACGAGSQATEPANSTTPNATEAPAGEATKAQAKEPGAKVVLPTNNIEHPADTDYVEPSPGEYKDASGKSFIVPGDFSLKDQNGKRWTLSQLKGKVVLLNFWQTWCPPCRAEMPDLQKIYEKYGKNEGDVVILGMESPKNELNTTYTQENNDVAGIKKFLEDNGYTYPTLMDMKADLFVQYRISAFPTTYVIHPDGYILGYVPGMLTTEAVENLIAQATGKPAA